MSDKLIDYKVAVRRGSTVNQGDFAEPENQMLSACLTQKQKNTTIFFSYTQKTRKTA
jgi:hypothetical protein